MKSGTLQDAFGAGTAATLAHIAVIGYEDEVFHLPALESRELSLRIKNHLDAIKLGEAEDSFGWNALV